jgi:hypothetical protein
VSLSRHCAVSVGSNGPRSTVITPVGTKVACAASVSDFAEIPSVVGTLI